MDYIMDGDLGALKHHLSQINQQQQSKARGWPQQEPETKGSFRDMTALADLDELKRQQLPLTFDYDVLKRHASLAGYQQPQQQHISTFAPTQDQHISTFASTCDSVPMNITGNRPSLTSYINAATLCAEKE